MAKIKNFEYLVLTKMWKDNPPPGRCEYKLGQPRRKAIWQYLSTVNTVLLFDIRLGFYPSDILETKMFKMINGHRYLTAA